VTFDERTERNLATLLPEVLPDFRTLVLIAKEIAEDLDLTVKVISGLRTWDEQTALYAKGRTKPGNIVTRAPAGYSNHNYAVACDFGLFRGNDYLDGSDPEYARKFYKMVFDSAKSNDLNMEWGGDWTFVDNAHFQWITGLSMVEMRERHKREIPIV